MKGACGQEKELDRPGRGEQRGNKRRKPFYDVVSYSSQRLFRYSFPSHSRWPASLRSEETEAQRGKVHPPPPQSSPCWKTQEPGFRPRCVQFQMCCHSLCRAAPSGCEQLGDEAGRSSNVDHVRCVVLDQSLSLYGPRRHWFGIGLPGPWGQFSCLSVAFWMMGVLRLPLISEQMPSIIQVPFPL